MNNNELYHYGVLGMKWGHRKASSSANSGYSSKQRKRDRAFYGNRGEKRINKKLNQGHGLQGARHYEVERRERREKTKKTLKKGARKTAKIMSTIGTMYVTDQLFYGGAGTRFAKQAATNAGRAVVNTVLKANGHTNIHWYG